jgi:hypothetical protein
VAQHDRRVDVQHEPRQRPAEHGRGRQQPASLEQLRPRHLPGRGTSNPQPLQGRLVDRVEDPPRGRVAGHRPEQARLLPQHREIGDRRTTIGQQHRQIDRDPARVMRRTTLPAHPQSLAEIAGQSGLISKVGEQPGAGMGDHTTGATSDDNLRTGAGILHRESAFRDGRFWP